jgi:hypothetical protein
MKIIPITKIEVINTIKSLQTKNSSGYDRITNNILECFLQLPVRYNTIKALLLLLL